MQPITTFSNPALTLAHQATEAFITACQLTYDTGANLGHWYYQDNGRDQLLTTWYTTLHYGILAIQFVIGTTLLAYDYLKSNQDSLQDAFDQAQDTYDQQIKPQAIKATEATLATMFALTLATAIVIGYYVPQVIMAFTHIHYRLINWLSNAF